MLKSGNKFSTLQIKNRQVLLCIVKLRQTKSAGPFWGEASPAATGWMAPVVCRAEKNCARVDQWATHIFATGAGELVYDSRSCRSLSQIMIGNLKRTYKHANGRTSGRMLPISVPPLEFVGWENKAAKDMRKLSFQSIWIVFLDLNESINEKKWIMKMMKAITFLS